jgi:sugar phosphate isomerase/epimerase
MNQRRSFLKKSIAAIAAVVAAPVFLKAQSSQYAEIAKIQDTAPQKLSVLSYSFHGLVQRGMQDIFGFMETCKYRYHLNTADLWNGHLAPGKSFVDPNDKANYVKLNDEYIAKVKEALDERELYIPNLACDGCHVLDIDPEITKITNARAWEHLKAAKTLGIGFVRIDAGPQMSAGKTDWTNEEFDIIVKHYKEYAQYAYDNGFKAGAENHMGPSIYWKNMKKLMEAVNHPGFAFCVHIGGWRGTPEEIALADKECAPYAAHTHIAWNICEGPLVQKMNDLRTGGYKGYYSVEHHSGKNEYEMVAIQLAQVAAVLRSWEMGGDGSEISKIQI